MHQFIDMFKVIQGFHLFNMYFACLLSLYPLLCDIIWSSSHDQTISSN